MVIWCIKIIKLKEEKIVRVLFPKMLNHSKMAVISVQGAGIAEANLLSHLAWQGLCWQLMAGEAPEALGLPSTTGCQ